MDKKPMTSTVRVSGYPDSTRKEDLSDLFSDCGRVRSVLKSATDNFAFIEFEHQSGAKSAMRQFHGKEYRGATLKVDLSYKEEDALPPQKPERREHSPARHDDRDYQNRRVAPGQTVDRYEPAGLPASSRYSNLTNVVCYNCNEPGHKAPFCPHPPRDPRYSDTRGTKIQSNLSTHRERDEPYYSRGPAAPSRVDDYHRDYNAPAPTPAPVAPSMGTPTVSKNDEELFKEFMAFRALKEQMAAVSAPVTAPSPALAPAPVRATDRYDSYPPRSYSPPAPRYGDSRGTARHDPYGSASSVDSYQPQRTSYQDNAYRRDESSHRPVDGGYDNSYQRNVAVPPRGGSGRGRGGYHHISSDRYTPENDRKLRNLGDDSGRRY